MSNNDYSELVEHLREFGNGDGMLFCIDAAEAITTLQRQACGGEQMRSSHISKFKEWFDAVLVGDGDAARKIPSQGDQNYPEYLRDYTLALGAWVASIDAVVSRLKEMHKELIWAGEYKQAEVVEPAIEVLDEFFPSARQNALRVDGGEE